RGWIFGWKHPANFPPHGEKGGHGRNRKGKKNPSARQKKGKKPLSSHSGFPGGLKTATAQHVFRKDPTALLTRAIEGMLPKTPLGNHMAKKLRIYAGPAHPHEAQGPEPITL